MSNLTLADMEVDASGGPNFAIGGLVGDLVGDLVVSDVTASALVVKGASAAVGGLVGGCYDGDSVKECDLRVERTVISGLNVTSSGQNDIGGLVGRCNGVCEFTHLTVSGTVTGGSNVGGVVGYGGFTNGFFNSQLTFSNVSVAIDVNAGSSAGGLVGTYSGTLESSIVDTAVSGTVDGSGSTIGGLFGTDNASADLEILNSSSSATVTGCSRVGGLVGTAHALQIVGSFTSGSVTSTGEGCSINAGAGGLVGLTYSGASISRSYSTSSVSGIERTGGLAGTGVQIENSYFRGTLTRSDGNLTSFGGLIGRDGSSESRIRDSYAALTSTKTLGKGLVAEAASANNPLCDEAFWDTTTSEVAADDCTAVAPDWSGSAGKTSPEMKTLDTFTDAGWDFIGESANGNNDIWAIDLTGVINDGYPYLNGVGIGVDTIAPSVAIGRSGSGALGVGGSDTVTFTLSEASTDFVVGDVSVSGGVLSGFAGSGASYSVTFTPEIAAVGSATIDVPAGSFTDAAGNPNTAATQFTIPYDTTVDDAPVILPPAPPNSEAPVGSTTVPTTAPVPVISTPVPVTTNPPATTPPVKPVIALEAPQPAGAALSVRTDGTIIESTIAVVPTARASTITIRNSDGSMITVVHEPTLVRTNFEVYRGTSLSVSGEGYAPETPIDLWLHSDPVFLARVITDGIGSFVTDALIVEGTSLGLHTLQVEGTAVDGVEQSTFLGLRVLDRSRPSVLPSTGTSPSAGLSMLAVVLGVWTLMLAGRRRRV